MKVKQISVMVENQFGKLAQISDFLAKNNINMRAMSIADTQSFGILRMIVDCPDRAQQLLTEAGYVVKVTEVVAVEIDDKPGSLASVVRRLTDAGISIEYAYAFTTTTVGKACLVFRVDNNEKALSVL